ncbi:MAG: YqaJ viral recombinase family protein [Mycobacterium sp.]
MQIHDVEQGSAEWAALRMGRPTASRFDCLMTSAPVYLVTAANGEITRHRSEATAQKKVDAWTKKDIASSYVMTFERSAQGERYMIQLLAEWATGEPGDGYESQAMLRGTHLEAEAVDYYEMMRGEATRPVGFITNDAGAGCSPDRLSGEGGLEIKCPGPAVHMRYLLGGGISDEYRHQVQGCLWVSGLAWWDTLSYHPDMPGALRRELPDPEWQAQFAPIFAAFADEMEAKRETLRGMGLKAWGDR